MTETGENIFFWIAIFAAGSALINGAGILAIHLHKEWAESVKPYFMCFASGMLVTSALTMALPNAARANMNAGYLALAGFLFMFLSSKVIAYLTKKRQLAFGVTAAEGIGIHSFIDGIIYTVTFNVSVLVGVLATTGLVIHEFAEGVITYLFLVKGGVERKYAIFWAFAIAGLTTPIGAFVVYPIVSTFDKSLLGLMLGFVAGVLIYVSASHLLPEATEYEKKHSLAAFLAGIGLSFFIMFSKIL